jgi:hypothetical protein
MNSAATGRSVGSSAEAPASASATWLFVIGQVRPFQGQFVRLPRQVGVAEKWGSSFGLAGTGKAVQNFSGSSRWRRIEGRCSGPTRSVKKG